MASTPPLTASTPTLTPSASSTQPSNAQPANPGFIAVGGKKAIRMQRQLFELLRFLKEQDGEHLPWKVASEKLGFNVTEVDFIPKWKECDKVGFDVTSRTIWYNHDFTVKNKDDLIELLRGHSKDGGIDVREVKQTFPGVYEAIKELEALGTVFVLRNKDDTPRVIFYNSLPMHPTGSLAEFPASTEFHEYWHKVSIPSDPAELLKELEKAGLKTIETTTTTNKPKPVVKLKSKKGRKIKITNTHLEGVDLSKDWTIDAAKK